MFQNVLDVPFIIYFDDGKTTEGVYKGTQYTKAQLKTSTKILSHDFPSMHQEYFEQFERDV